MRVILTDYAKSQVKLIVLYYKENASVSIASEIKKAIFQRLKLLPTNPSIGPSEKYLEHHHLNHRYLVEGNYKIIYRIEGNHIFVTDIFDSRQNPDKANP